MAQLREQLVALESARRRARRRGPSSLLFSSRLASALLTSPLLCSSHLFSPLLSSPLLASSLLSSLHLFSPLLFSPLLSSPLFTSSRLCSSRLFSSRLASSHLPSPRPRPLPRRAARWRCPPTRRLCSCRPAQHTQVPGSWVGVRRPFPLSLSLTSSRMVSPQDPSTHGNPPEHPNKMLYSRRPRSKPCGTSSARRTRASARSRPRSRIRPRRRPSCSSRRTA